MRYTQPQSGPIQVDPGNPIARGIDVAFVRLDQPGLIGAAALTKAGSPSLIATKYGQGSFLGNSGSDAFDSSAWPVLADGTEYTYLIVTQLTATGTTDYLINGDNTFRAFQFRIETTGAPGFIGFNTAVTTFSAVGSVIPVGQVQAIVARSSTTAVSLFQNGVKTATTAASGTIKGQSASDIRIANRLGLNLHGSIGLLIRWPRALSDTEAKAVTANPWQLFRSPQRVMLASGAGPDVSVALTGQSATASRGTVAPAMSVGMTGQSAQVLRGSVSVSGSADVTVALSGQALTASLGALAPSAAKALIGQAQSAQQGLLTPARAIIISGQAATASRGSIAPSTAAALAGQSGTAQRGTVAAPGNVVVALSGQAAATAQGSISPFATSRAVLNGTTIMRASVTNNSVSRLVASIAASGGTMRASAAGTTIMRASPINSTGRMSNSAINCTANLL